jgi:hypothetical protein
MQMIRNSERSDFKKCQALWNWRWVEGLVPVMQRQDARWFGTGIHLALAEYYTPQDGDGFKRGIHPVETWMKYSKNAYTTVSAGQYFDDEAEAEFVNAEKLGIVMLDNYVNQYKGDPQWEVLMPETRFEAKIPYNDRQKKYASEFIATMMDHDPHIAKMVGTFDMPVRDHTDGHIKIVDHKTTAKRESTAWLIKDDQAGTYITVATGYLRRAGLIRDDEAVTGAVWNYLRKAKPPDKPTNEKGQVLNKDGSVSKVQPAPLFWRESVVRGKVNRLRQLSRMADDAEEMALKRIGVSPILKAPGEHCSWCDMRDLCDIDENGDDIKQFKHDVFRVEDPYADHREGAVNSKVGVL